MKYILVTFYPVYREARETPIWLVYGHIAPGVNEGLGEYELQAEAIQKAFTFGVPVMLGRGYEEALEKLAA